MHFRIAFLLFIMLPVFLSGQDYGYIQLSTEDGLPSNKVYQIIQDKKGYLWFATEGGVAKYDGYSFKNFSIRDGLPTNDVFLLSEDAYDRIWIQSTSNKIGYIRADSVHIIPNLEFDRYLHNIDISPNNVSFIVARNKTWQYISIDSADHFFDTDFSVKPYSVGSPDKYFLEFIQDSVLIYEKGKRIKKWHFSKSYKYFPSGNFFSSHGFFIFPDPTFEQLILFRPENLREYNIDLKSQFGDIPAFVRYQVMDSSIFIQTDIGLLKLDSNANLITKVIYPSFLGRSKTHQGFIDNEGGLWICTKGEGVYYLSNAGKSHGLIHLPDGNIPTAIKYSNEGLFIGDSNGTVYRCENDLLPKPVYTSDNLNHDETITCIDVLDSTLYFSNRNSGMFEYNLANNEIKNLNLDDKLTFDSAIVNYNASHGRSNRDEVLKQSGYDIRSFFINKTQQSIFYYSLFIYQYDIKNLFLRLLSSNVRRINTILQDSINNLWVATNQGLFKININGIATDSPENSFNGNATCLNMYNNNVLIAFESLGIYSYDHDQSGSMRRLFDMDGTLNELEIENDTLYAAGSKGIQVFLIERSENGNLSLESINHYGKKNGLNTLNVNQIELSDNLIYAATAKGIVILNKKPPQKSQTPLPIHINHILSNGKPIEPKTDTSFSYNQNEFEFHFTALSYESGMNTEYTYQLKNYDRLPKTNKSRVVYYSALSAGHYIFEVKAHNAYGKQSNTEVFSFTVKPAWWQLLWVRLSFLVGLGGLLYFILRLIIKRIKKQESAKIIMNRRFAELELSALQAQMNPHFLFNALASIQKLIISNQNDAAETYIGKMSMLLRMFLESSRHRFISLAEELNMVDIYVQLEQLRLKDKLDYAKYVSKDLDLGAVKIPATLLHIFVENAITHGLFHKESKGTLNIEIKSEEGNIICLIEDDGIGQVRANEIKKSAIHDQPSRGIQIIMEKVEALKKIRNYEIKIDIIDKIENDAPTGTLVSIKFPINTNDL